MSRWTAEEQAVLRETYGSSGIHATLAALPHRSRTSVFHQACRMGLTRRRRWTRDHDEQLRRVWDGGSQLRIIAKQMKRSQLACWERARALGLKTGVAEGYESLGGAARRTGYSDEQLRRILGDAGVSLNPRLSRPNGQQVRTMLWPADVDAAIADYMEREPLSAAARRLDMQEHQLRALLKRAGVAKTTPVRRHWRVSREDVEKALGAQNG